MSAGPYTAAQEDAAAALGVPLGRVSYRVAGAALRATCRRANLTADLCVSDWRLLCAVLGLTTSYSKLCDLVSVPQLVEASGLSDRQVRRSLARLRKAGVIVHAPGNRGTP
jgi:hypothetical protein